MHRERMDETNVQLAEADAVWITEIARIFGVERVDACAATQEGQGDPGTPLRQAYVLRRSVQAAWRTARCLD